MSNDTPIAVLVADDHPMFRRGVVEAIAEDARMNVVAEAGDGAETLALLEKTHVDVAVLDVDMPVMDGLEVALKLSTRKPEIRVVILTLHKRERIFNAALDAGVSAYHLKDEAVETIVDAILRVARDEVYISPAMSEFVMRRGRRNRELRESASGFDALTRRNSRFCGWWR